MMRVARRGVRLSRIMGNAGNLGNGVPKATHSGMRGG
jgi:hypothetical protein